jgi:putative glycosyltransferase (TIGR04348 family)
MVCPATTVQNNGNWRTAERWAALLSRYAQVSIHLDVDEVTIQSADIMIALHARRSASAIQSWRHIHPTQPLIVVLTGTDLYRDIANHPEAQKSLDLADRLVVLQELGIQALPLQHQAKTHCIFQSTRSWKPAMKSSRKLRVLMVGHLRDEKSPQTFFEASRTLATHQDIQFDLIGSGLEPRLLEEAQELDRSLVNFRYLGALPHSSTRRHIRHAHLLIHSSAMEGGAHVIMEAICSGTPVLASNISGNRGMLGSQYDGYFDWGQSDQLCGLLLRCRNSQMQKTKIDRFLDHLTAQCAERANLFTPDNEQHSLLELLNECLPA